MRRAKVFMPARNDKPRGQHVLAGFEGMLKLRFFAAVSNPLVPRAGIEPARLAAGDFEIESRD